MKLTAKLVLLFLVITSLLLAVDSYLALRRERSFFHADMKRDAELLAGAVQRMVEDVGGAEGLERALELIDDLNRRQRRLKIRWVWLDAVPGEPGPLRDAGPAPAQERISETESSAFSVRDDDGRGHFFTYSPTRFAGRAGAVEIVQPLDAMDRHLRTSMRSSLWLAGALVVLCAMLFVPLGVRMVGRPLRRLAEKARAVGAGDLSRPVSVAGHDELSELGTAMNLMCTELAASQANLRAETAERIAAIERLRHADRLRTIGQLASGVAHELGTPLNVVSGRASQIAKGGLSLDEARAAAEIIKGQSARMTEIIRQLLHFARRQPPRKSLADLWQVLRQASGLLEPIARKRDAELDVGEEEEAAFASIDPGQIEQVLTNLLINAIDAMPEGGRVRAAIHRERTAPPADPQAAASAFWRIDVQDEGEGIPEDQLDLLFEPFFTTKGGEGTGLGLSIAQGIVEEHGGWITVASEAGRGTRLSVYLPVEDEP
jgi:signal transduction histidine kinase